MNVKDEIDRRKSNTHRILRLLKKKGHATNSQLIAIGGYRYGARLFELRQEGHVIVSVHVKDGLWDFIYKGQKDEIIAANKKRPFEDEKKSPWFLKRRKAAL